MAPDKSAWVVHKFDGTSVADAAGFRRVAEIIETRANERQAIVVSACAGVTNALLAIVSAAEKRDDPVNDLGVVRTRHASLAEALLTPAAARDYGAALDVDVGAIEGALATVRLAAPPAAGVRDLVAGYGEIWASRLLAALLRGRGRCSGEVQWLDAREAVIVDPGPLGPVVDWSKAHAQMRRLVAADFGGALVITGANAADRSGAPTNLGRDGGDFSASIFAALLGAAEIHIWTTAAGVLSADPDRVPEATIIDQLSYNEAMELAYFGARIIHPQTMAPAVKLETPIWIRNALAPDQVGTLICANPASAHAVKGITTIDQIAMINLEGAAMIGAPGTAHRLFGALRDAGVSVILISQGSSEHSICCAVPQNDAARATAAIRAAFERELREGQIQSVGLDAELAILAVVGDGMAGTPGVAAKLFTALSAASVNVRAIAQGSSERNISVVVEAGSATRALRAAHAGFYLSPHTLSVGVIGPGVVGGVFLDQVAAQAKRLREQFGLHLRVCGIMASNRMALSETGIDGADWRGALARLSEPADIERFFAHVQVEHLPHNVVIDCSASEAVAGRYRELFERGVHVITPNKKANSADFSYYSAMLQARRRSGAHYLYEATVGAGLPIIHTVRDLRETGDDILSIEGIFSGTLSYLFNAYDDGAPFSDVVRDARRRGYTEPDPRDDLSGLDVARKLVILAREMGLSMELKEISIESLVPAELGAMSVEDFLEHLPRHDEAMRARYDGARARAKVLRHVGRVTAAGEAFVKLIEVDAKHPFANIAMTDNVVRFQTRRYHDNPLIVQGPGAGPEVTAGGVFADLLRLASYLGARM